MKKAACWLLVGAMFASALTTAFGASADAGMEAAILAAKKVIEIPKDYTEFSGSSMETDREQTAQTVWELSWSDEKRTGEITACVTGEGTLLTMNRYQQAENQGLGTVTRAAGKKSAEDFLKKALGEKEAALLREINAEENGARRGTNMYFTFRRYQEGIPVRDSDIQVAVNRYSGEIVSFANRNGAIDIQIEEKGDVVDKADGIQAFFAAYPLELRYHSYFDYESETLKVFPVYECDALADQAVDARTKEAVTQYRDNSYWFGVMRNESASDAAGEAVKKADSGLSPEEQAELAAVQGLISGDKAVSILRKAFPELGSSPCVEKSMNSVKQGVMAGSYRWNLSFERGYGSVNAATGEVLSFYLWQDADSKTKTSIKQETALARATARVEDLLSEEKLSQVAPVKADDQAGSASYSFRWNRMAGDIPYVDNGVSITVDGATGNIESYRLTWYDQAEFPELAGGLTEEAEAAYAQLNGLELYFMRTEKDGAYHPVYAFSENRLSTMMDVATGEALRYDGTPAVAQKRPEYSDLAGHWSRKAVESLKENGYYLEGEKFQPDKVITQGEFLQYLYGKNSGEVTPLAAVKRAADQGFLTTEEMDEDQPLTRGMAAKIAVRYLGLEAAAEHPEIFANLFSDAVPTEYRGYAAICKGMNVMSGDKAGRFNAAGQMTRGQAASVLYRLLSL